MIGQEVLPRSLAAPLRFATIPLPTIGDVWSVRIYHGLSHFRCFCILLLLRRI